MYIIDLYSYWQNQNKYNHIYLLNNKAYNNNVIIMKSNIKHHIFPTTYNHLQLFIILTLFTINKNNITRHNYYSVVNISIVEIVDFSYNKYTNFVK